MPLYAPTFLLKRLIKGSRPQLREIIERSYKPDSYEHGMQVGKSHRFIVEPSQDGKLAVSRHGRDIIVKQPNGLSLSSPAASKQISSVVNAALRHEAKSYLPRRLEYLADKYDFKYTKVRFSHAGGRWGSCSSNGTISLNIALMKLPFELIDYVLIHELSHTSEMNHSAQFWALVASADPDYKQHRRLLRDQNPSI